MTMTTTNVEQHLIEAGFTAFAAAQAPLRPEEIIDMRIAFYAGAQHLLMSMARAQRRLGPEISYAELDRELREFADECALRHVHCEGNA
jgi:hypothetical protein